MPVNQYQKKQDTSFQDALNIYNSYSNMNKQPSLDSAPPKQDATQGSAVDSGSLKLPEMSLPKEGPALPPEAATSNNDQASAMQRAADAKLAMNQKPISPPPKNGGDNGLLGTISGILSYLA